jgi:hypothetical protein
MIRAVLRGSGPSSLLPVEVCRALVQTARSQADDISLSVRRRALYSARRIRERARRRGYEDGLRAARAEAGEVLEGIRVRYADAVARAEQDSSSLAYRLAEVIVQQTFERHPETFLPLLSRALQILKRGRSFHLTYHPRYEKSIQLLAPSLPPGIILRADVSMERADFSMSCEEGAVESAWRAALSELLPTAPPSSADTEGK